MRAIIFVFFVVVTFVLYFTHSNAQLPEAEPDLIPSLLLESVVNGDLDGLHRALNAGENIDVKNDKGWTAARFAVALGDLDYLRALIDAGIDLNNADNDGVSPLMAASEDGDREAVETLLAGNASPLQTTNDGNDAFTFAQRSGRNVITLLIAEAAAIHAINSDDLQAVLSSVGRGAYVNIRNSVGWTPLILACARGDLEAVKTLLKEYHADPNRTENDGWTALHFAADGGFDKIVDELLKVGARNDLRNSRGQTAREIAMAHKFLTIVDKIPDVQSEF